ncbi:caspase family protein [Dapis sp. BLCC M229]|uniref:caspase family protein n=1 Tax=Dapis sp. BLCC M229 TaxID=3400188 RepID=UPI003CF21ED8
MNSNKKIYALLVGIDQYAPDSEVPTLKGCENDIKAIEAYLKDQIAGEWELFEPRILTNEQATRQGIIDGFQEYLCQAGTNDIVLFYYSGHGGQQKTPEELLHLDPDNLNETLVCYDSRSPGGYDLADKELKYLLAKVAEKEPRVIVIFDCCHAGAGTRSIDPSVLGTRLAPEDTRDRPLSSFIFAQDEKFKNLLLTSSEVDKKKTGLDLPRGKHILLAACRDYQYSKEYKGDDGEPRGVFSYSLLQSLQQTNGRLSYSDLARNVAALVKGKVQDQDPQLEATNPEDLKESFLGDAIPERPFYFTLTYNTKPKEKSWEIDGGALQGIPKTSKSAKETTLLAIFPVGSTPDDLKEISKAVGEAKVTKVLTAKSKVEITPTQGNLDENQSYWAVITSLPIEKLKVYIEGNLTEEEGINLVKQALEEINSGQKSLYVEQVEDSTEANCTLLVDKGQYLITQGKTPVVAPIPKKPGYSKNAATEAIEALEAIARWTNILNLKSAKSSIKPTDVEMEIIKYGYEDEEGEITVASDSDKSLSTGSEYYLEYKYENGEWKRPVIKLKLTNHSNQKLYCAVLLLSSDYSIEPRIHFYPYPENPEEYESSTIAVSGANSGESNSFESFVFVAIQEDFLENGITEIKDVLKLIVSKTDFNADLLQQEGLEPPQPTRALPEGTLESLMQQVSTRGAAKSRKKIDDWITKEVTVTVVKPRDAEQLQSDRNAKLMNGLVEVQFHPSLQAKVTLTTVSQTTRSVGNVATPPLLREEPGAIESFQFTTSRNSDPGLAAVELFNVNDVNLVTKDAPLKLLVDQSLEEDEYILPISHDGEFFLPLGNGAKKGEQTEITLERLPKPTTSSRSLDGSIKIFFKKLKSQKLGTSYEYPILASAEVKQENNREKVIYEKNIEEVKKQVDSAQKIILYIHGIIGDTETMVGSVQRAKVEINGEQRPLRELYDLVLTFDYENLQTTIEENARLLKKRLETVGLGANHGKELHIVAHSMGGLVSRWFIEQEGGNEVVQHLVMLGTPNGGSPWPQVQELAFVMLNFGLNKIPTMAWPAKVVADMGAKSLQFIEANDNSLDQMQPDSEFITKLAENPDPHVRYSIISGDRSMPTSKKQSSFLEKFKAKLFDNAVTNAFLDGLVFGAEPNDIAVHLANIKKVSSDRSPQPRILPDVACDHLTYFTSEAGLKALVDALSS